MDRKMEVRYGSNSMKDYQKDIINSGRCDLFMPMSFVVGKGNQVGLLEAEGTIPLSSLERISGRQCLDIIISLIGKMIEAEKRYLFIGEYSIREEVIMVDERTLDVRLIYWPFAYSNSVSLLADLIKLMRTLKRKVPENEAACVEEAITFVSKGKAGLSMILHRLEIMRLGMGDGLAVN